MMRELPGLEVKGPFPGKSFQKDGSRAPDTFSEPTAFICFQLFSRLSRGPWVVYDLNFNDPS